VRCGAASAQAAAHLARRVTAEGQPASRYWRFHLTETAIYLGWHVWTTPTGRTYTQEPWRYTA
jgi:hypothetical protein